ncbi:MAG: ATP-dependent helicase HrpB [Hyphomicrobiaceae bacterium]
MHAINPLPVDSVLADLKAALTGGTSAVLVAPPGAGKTTRVPSALLGEAWLGTGKILVLEPRRIAARAAAEYTARLLGDRLGGTIGLRTRLATRVGPDTRIEFVTEGIFTRLILDDPALAGIGAVIFDEFHERSIDADFGLALALDARGALRPDLRILVMSATLKSSAVATLLGNVPIIKSEGRAFPIDTRYLGRSPHARIERQMSDAILDALRADTGSILAFLPGQAEIRRVATLLEAELTRPDISIVALHGGLDQKMQSEAISPARTGHRKVVLATSVAETSITIEGVRIVIDCGLQRLPRYDPEAGITRLETVRVSRASADQRRGRAGRTEPGVCYRLWSEPETLGLLPFTPPEIRSADLATLLLDCAAWGETNVRRLAWLDPPPQSALDAARTHLQEIGALDNDGRITAMGRRLRALPMPPRLARMVLIAAEHGSADQAAELAALLVERNLGGTDADIEVRLANFRRERSQRADGMRRMADRWARDARNTTAPAGDVLSTASLVALAYPQRVAKARGERGRFLLANGRAAQLDPTDPLARSPYLMVAELSGTAANARILLAAAASETDVLIAAGDRIAEQEDVSFDKEAAAVRSRAVRRLGAIELSNDPRPAKGDESTARALARGVASLGLDRLPWSKAQLQLRHRVGFLRKTQALLSSTLPDLTNEALAATIENWLAPFLFGQTRLADISADDLGNALDNLIPWDVKRQIDAEMPTHFEAPTGNRHLIDYDSEHAPAVSLRVQELFGCQQHPAIAHGRLPLTLMLLAPSGRPLQITRDLPGFWSGSWADVRSEMRGRYPKHPWPDDPAHAAPTARAKPRPR